MFYIDKGCPACRAGLLGFLKCSDDQTIVLVCDECDAVWLNATDISVDAAVFPDSPDDVLAGLGCSIASPHARWATRDEIQRAGLESLIAGEWTRP